MLVECENVAGRGHHEPSQDSIGADLDGGGNTMISHPTSGLSNPNKSQHVALPETFKSSAAMLGFASMQRRYRKRSRVIALILPSHHGLDITPSSANPIMTMSERVAHRYAPDSFA
jgi:hypothetical protein